MHLAKGKEAATGRSMGTCRFVSAPLQPLYAPLGIRDDMFQPVAHRSLKSSVSGRDSTCWCYTLSSSAPSIVLRTLNGDAHGETDLSTSLVIIKDGMNAADIQSLADQKRHPEATLVLSPPSSSDNKGSKGSRRRHGIGSISHRLDTHMTWTPSSAARSRGNQKRHCFISDPPSDNDEDMEEGFDTWMSGYEAGRGAMDELGPILHDEPESIVAAPPSLHTAHSQDHSSDHHLRSYQWQQHEGTASASSGLLEVGSTAHGPAGPEVGKKYFVKKKKPLAKPSTGPPESDQSKWLTHLSSRAPSWHALSVLFAEASARKELHGVHVTAMLTRLSHLQDGTGPSLHYDPSKYLSSSPSLSSDPSRESSARSMNSSHSPPPPSPSPSSSPSRFSPPKKKPPQSPSHLATALCKEADALLPSMGLWEVSSSLSSLVKLGCVPQAGKPLVIRFMTRAFHLLGQLCSKSASSLALSEEEWNERGAREAHSLTTLIRAISLSGMTGLRADWAARFFRAVESRSRCFTSQGVAVVFHSLAVIQHSPPPELRQLLFDQLVLSAESSLSACPSSSSTNYPSPRLPCSPADVSMTIWALAKLRAQPPEHLGSRLFLAMRPHLPLFSAQELAVTQWGLAKLRFQPSPEWCRDVLAEAETKLFFSSRGDSTSSQRSSSMSKSFDSGSAQSLSMLLYSCAVLKLRPDHQWLESILSLVMRESDCFTLQGLASIVYGLGLMGYHPGPKWLNKMRQEVSSRSTAASLRARRVGDGTEEVHPASLSMLRKGFAMLGRHRKVESDNQTTDASSHAESTCVVRGDLVESYSSR